MGNLARRILVAVVGIPVAVLFVYVGDLAFALFLSTLAVLGAREFYALSRQSGIQPIGAIGIPLAAGFPLGAHLVRLGWVQEPEAVLGILFVALIGAVLFARAAEDRPIESAAITVFGALYAGGTLAAAYALRHQRWTVGALAGSTLLLYPVVLTWTTDTAAYFVGRAFGRRKLMPKVSPGKTVAGAVGGVVLATVVSLVYDLFVLRPVAQLALTPWTALALGVLVSAAAQVGDLAESLFKRQAGVKDSSNLLPGHGGILDRLDSLYFVLPVGYLVLNRLLLPAPT